MITTAQARAMAQYNGWMNDRLYEACATLSDAQRKEDVGAFFKSIHGTLNHILLADRIWMSRFTGTSFHVQSLDQEVCADFAGLRRERRDEDARILKWAESLDEGKLGESLSYRGIANPAPRRYPLWFAVAHFFNHQTHHRGQVTTLLMQRGVDMGVTDLIALPAYQENGGDQR